MITPGYSLTAPERVLPRLALDFTTGVLDSRVTVTRALNTATRVNSSGYIETVNANLPRFDYSPTSVGTPRGLLIEEARANLLLWSAEFNQSAWTKSDTTIGTTAITAPDGTLSAYKIEENGATSSHYVSQSVTTTAATHGFSTYLKAAERSFVLFWSPTTNFGRVFDIGTGNLSGTVPGVTQATAEITPAGDNWYRCTIYGTCSAASNAFRIYTMTNATTFSYAGSVGSGVYAWGAQVEAGAFATSYIPTTTTSLTRNADAVSMTGTNFSDWYNATEGTLQVIGSMNTASTSIFQTFAMIGDANNSLQIFNNLSASRFRGDIYSGGALQKAFTYTAAGAPASGTTYNIIVGMKANDFAMAINGNTVATANSGLMPVSPTALYIGSVNIGIQQIGGYIRKLAYYKQKLTNAEIQAFSK